jgi:hypothetical protein
MDLKIVVILMLVLILVFLGRGVWFLAKGGDTGNSVVNSLAVRVGISIVLFALLIVGYTLGYIQPNFA